LRTRHTPQFFPTIVALVLAGLGLAAQGLSIGFDDDVPGMAPRGFLFAAARQTSPGTWEVQGAGGRRHLAHVADASAGGLSIAVLAAPAPANVRVTSRIRLVDGGRAGGLVWRYRDGSNYYAVGINLERHEAALHRIMGGNRIQLDHSSDLEVDPEAWHALGVVHQGDQIRVHLDGIAILHATDRGFDSGRAGVWSGGAASTWFDDLKIDEFPEPAR